MLFAIFCFFIDRVLCSHVCLQHVVLHCVIYVFFSWLLEAFNNILYEKYRTAAKKMGLMLVASPHWLSGKS